MASQPSHTMPDELSARHLGRRRQLEHAAPGWVVAGLVLEVLSALSYVVILRSVFCHRMSWRLSYQIGMADQAANSSGSGFGGSTCSPRRWVSRTAKSASTKYWPRARAHAIVCP